MSWFEVDRKGLGRQARERGIGRLIAELVRNSLDEDGVTTVDVKLETVEGRPLTVLTVTDDAPEGFADLRDAFTMFADSRKRDKPEKAGQFNIGEKHAIAACEEARIVTVKGGVHFDAEGRRSLRTKRERGSEFTGWIRMTREETRNALDFLEQLIVPAGVAVALNGVGLPRPVPVKTFIAGLRTRIVNDEGMMRDVDRDTTVELFPVRHAAEKAMIFELGVPVVETGDRWHANVMQKVPLNRDRDNVTPSFLRDLRTAVANAARDFITHEDAKSTWVKEVLPFAEPATVQKIVREAHGEGAVIFDPSCPEANKRALDLGRTVIHGGSYSSLEWDSIRESGAVKPAGQHQELRGDVPTSPDGVPPIPRTEWEPEWVRVADYATALAWELCGKSIGIQVYRINGNWAASCGRDSGVVSFNARMLGKGWWTDQVMVDELLLHEFAHFKVSDHLSDDFHEECCRLGAKLRGCRAKLEGGA